MVRLCRLVEPISIRPPQSLHLKPFTFFTSRAREGDGSEQLYLHMGFFETLAYAERWARAVRGRHPDAIATITPPAFWQLPDSDVASVRADHESLTDTQVLNILEARRPASAPSDSDARVNEQIEILRPDDTGTRRALKEAVVQGAPVFFAVQLHWLVRSIDPGVLPSLPVFDSYTLYAVESRRSSRSCFFLRLGFFADPISAKQVALHVRSSFASAAVVPVLEEEVTRARAAGVKMPDIPCLVQQRVDPPLESGIPAWATPSAPGGARRRSAETLEQTLAQLAEREMLNDPELLSESGVRHLKIEVRKQAFRRRH